MREGSWRLYPSLLALDFKSGVNQITVTANLRWTQNWQFLHPENLSQNARFCTRTFPCDRGYMINTHYVISDVMPRKLLNVGFSDITQFFEVKWSLLKPSESLYNYQMFPFISLLEASLSLSLKQAIIWPSLTGRVMKYDVWDNHFISLTYE